MPGSATGVDESVEEGAERSPSTLVVLLAGSVGIVACVFGFMDFQPDSRLPETLVVAGLLVLVFGVVVAIAVKSPRYEPPPGFEDEPVLYGPVEEFVNAFDHRVVEPFVAFAVYEECYYSGAIELWPDGEKLDPELSLAELYPDPVDRSQALDRVAARCGRDRSAHPRVEPLRTVRNLVEWLSGMPRRASS